MFTSNVFTGTFFVPSAVPSFDALFCKYKSNRVFAVAPHEGEFHRMFFEAIFLKIKPKSVFA